MAALFEVSTLCALSVNQNSVESGIQGIELGKDDDHVVVTESKRSVTLYKVSDQKPLGCWTVKQGQRITCPAVYNSKTAEYVVVTDSKVIRVWKDDDINIDKAFKATVSSDVWRIHSVPNHEPVVLFQKGATRHLDGLLADPQQNVENILSDDEVIRWSNFITSGKQQWILYITEKNGDQFLHVQSLVGMTRAAYRWENIGSSPLSFSASQHSGHLHILSLYPDGGVYESIVPMRLPDVVPGEVLPLPRTLLLRLPLSEGVLVSASVVPLDAAHVAVVGVPHPSAGAGKDYLCIWNTNFQTLQAGKEMAGRIYGQLWCYSGKLYIPHGKSLSVIPFECQKSSLAAALGKLRQSGACDTVSPMTLLSWGSEAPVETSAGGIDTRKRLSRKGQEASSLSFDQLIEKIKLGSEEEVQKAVASFLSKSDLLGLQLAVGNLASALVSRSLAEPSFYPHSVLVQLVHTQCLCHSVCPDLLKLVLEKKDFALCQFCLQIFPDIPEALTCACLKVFLSTADSELEVVTLEMDSVAFVEGLSTAETQLDKEEKEGEETRQQNGFTAAAPPPEPETSCEGQLPLLRKPKLTSSSMPLDMRRPVSLHRAVLLNEIVQTPYSEAFLLPSLKELTVSQVILFLEYLQFLYVKYYQDLHTQVPAMRLPTMSQIIDWVCLLVDAHFTVLVMAPEAKELLSGLHGFVKAQMRLITDLGKIEGSLEALQKPKQTKDNSQYSIEVIELI